MAETRKRGKFGMLHEDVYTFNPMVVYFVCRLRVFVLFTPASYRLVDNKYSLGMKENGKREGESESVS